MGPNRTAALTGLILLSASPVLAQQEGWHYSPLPGEGDRASMGCARGSTPESFTCLVVRCETDFSTGLHVHTSRPGGGSGTWEMTLDRETRRLSADAVEAPYDGRLTDDGWLLDGLRHGSFVYLRHAGDENAQFDFIDLTGSYRSIAEALYWCAPRMVQGEQKRDPDVGTSKQNGEAQ